MSLQNLLDFSSSKMRSTKQGMSEERLKEQVPHLRSLISFFREYPDLFMLHSRVLTLNHSYL